MSEDTFAGNEAADHEERRIRQMHPDVAYLLKVVQARDDTITALRADVQTIPDKIGEAVQTAMLRVLSDQATWAAASAALRTGGSCRGRCW